MTTLKPETEKDRQIDELHSWYINNQIIIHPERDNIFRKELKQFIAKAEQRARYEEREKIIDRLYNSEISGWETYDIQCILEVINGEVK